MQDICTIQLFDACFSIQNYNCDSRESIAYGRRTSLFGEQKGSVLKPNASIRLQQNQPVRLATSKVNFGDATDDVHVGIMCLRAIMNHQVFK